MSSVQLNNLPRSAERITVAEAYCAALRLIDYYNSMGGSLDEILIDMSGDYGTDGKPNDPGAWSLWLDCLDNRTPRGGDGGE